MWFTLECNFPGFICSLLIEKKLDEGLEGLLMSQVTRTGLSEFYFVVVLYAGTVWIPWFLSLQLEVEYGRERPAEILVDGMQRPRSYGPKVFAMVRTYIDYQTDTIYLSVSHINIAYFNRTKMTPILLNSLSPFCLACKESMALMEKVPTKGRVLSRGNWDN
jgi:hypothetical protein